MNIWLNSGRSWEADKGGLQAIKSGFDNDANRNTDLGESGADNTQNVSGA